MNTETGQLTILDVYKLSGIYPTSVSYPIISLGADSNFSSTTGSVTWLIYQSYGQYGIYNISVSSSGNNQVQMVYVGLIVYTPQTAQSIETTPGGVSFLSSGFVLVTEVFAPNSPPGKWYNVTKYGSSGNLINYNSYQYLSTCLVRLANYNGVQISEIPGSRIPGNVTIEFRGVDLSNFNVTQGHPLDIDVPYVAIMPNVKSRAVAYNGSVYWVTGGSVVGQVTITDGMFPTGPYSYLIVPQPSGVTDDIAVNAQYVFVNMLDSSNNNVIGRYSYT